MPTPILEGNMNGHCHTLVANFALACLPFEERQVLRPRWNGLEAGATLSDEFRVMWDIAEAGKSRRHLIHRCYVDSDNPKDHGCATHAMDYATGSQGFVESYMAGEMDDAYPSEESFLENLAMFLGVASHHIADLCTPVHVGHKMDHRRAGAKSAAAFHHKFERQMGVLVNSASIELKKLAIVELDHEYFWGIAQATYEGMFLPLEDIYASDDKDAKLEITSRSLSAAVQNTADVWHTVLSSSGVAERKWSDAPLNTD